MNPNTVHDAQTEHDHQDKRTAVANQRQRNPGNRQDGNSHSDILEDVGEDERGNADDKKQPKLISCAKGNEQTGQQQEGEGAK